MFRDDFDRTAFLRLLIRSLARTEARCHAFCLMDTHYHALLEQRADVLQAEMQRLNGAYAQGFNRQYGRAGHLFGDRYRCIHVLTDEQFLRVVRYVVRNPVEAQLCDRPSDWFWSSHRDCVGLANDFPFVDHTRIHGYFRASGKVALHDIRGFAGDFVTLL
jgi:putative transposase